MYPPFTGLINPYELVFPVLAELLLFPVEFELLLLLLLLLFVLVFFLVEPFMCSRLYISRHCE